MKILIGQLGEIGAGVTHHQTGQASRFQVAAFMIGFLLCVEAANF